MKLHYLSFYLILFYCTMLDTMAQSLSPELQAYCKNLESEFHLISEERKENLAEIAKYIRSKLDEKSKSELTFICTHNSRRSQFGQVWAKIAAVYYGISDKMLQTYSGGTEATACNPRTVAALQRAGIDVEKINEVSAPITVADNPRYRVTISPKIEPMFLFSKVYDDAQNPSKSYCAILVCSQADESCPMVKGAEKRIYHGYNDPKKFDGQMSESTEYDKTCRLIAGEMFYVFKLVASK
jgi:arsenate reductase (thioredoxin)